jgi:hypothetical protein
MSGSGGGGFTTYDPPVIVCENLIIETAISSPKAAVVSELIVGDVLDVGLENAPGSMVVALYSNGQLAGGITHPSTNRLRECIQGGTRYRATVTSVSAGQVRVRITPV